MRSSHLIGRRLASSPERHDPGGDYACLEEHVPHHIERRHQRSPSQDGGHACAVACGFATAPYSAQGAPSHLVVRVPTAARRARRACWWAGGTKSETATANATILDATLRTIGMGSYG